MLRLPISNATGRGAGHGARVEERAVAAQAQAYCCVYCGHGLYVPPKAEVVRCPVCTREISVKDVWLSGDVARTESIVTAGRIRVSVGARVAADLVGCVVEVQGKVLGEVLASQECRVRCTGKVSGRIICRHLVIEPGAQVEGTIETVTDDRVRLP